MKPAGCPIRDWPGTSGTLAAGATERRELALTELFPDRSWEKGRYQLLASWEPAALEKYFDAGFAWRARWTSRNAPGFTLADPAAKLRIEAGKEATLPDGARLRFAGNGHKTMMVGGPESPLIIYGGFAAPGAKEPSTFERSLYPDENSVLTLGEGYAFLLGAYQYDGWMELSTSASSSADARLPRCGGLPGAASPTCPRRERQRSR